MKNELNKLKEAREEQNMTQEQLSSLSLVSRQTISDLENFKIKSVGKITMTKIAKALKKEVQDIFFC